MPNPRAIAIAVLAMLSFGVAIGAITTPSGSGTLLVQSVPPAQPATAKSPPAASSATPQQPVIPPLVQAPATASQAPSTSPKSSDAPELPPTALPPVKHVFLITLSNQGFDQAFGPNSQAPYLAQTLTPQGELLQNYFAVTQGELANEIALLSGQGPTQQTAADCPTYEDVTPGTTGQDGQIEGSDGCVYPTGTATLPDQLTSAGRSWKAYVQDIGNPCRHPTLGQLDPWHTPQPTDPYTTWSNPIVYFHSTIDGPNCATDDVGLDQLAPDLNLGTAAPSLFYIAPNRCNDGSDDPCSPAAPAGGLPAADKFLSTYVPQILASPAYQDGGLIAITFDQAPQTGPNADSSSCCGKPATYPNPNTPIGGGGRVGLLLISSFTQPGTTSQANYNHFSLLASIEDLFGLPRAGYAADPAVPVFDTSIYNAFQG